MNNRAPVVVIVGGGFAGLSAAKALRKAPVEIVLIDRTNHHLLPTSTLPSCDIRADTWANSRSDPWDIAGSEKHNDCSRRSYWCGQRTEVGLRQHRGPRRSAGLVRLPNLGDRSR